MSHCIVSEMENGQVGITRPNWNKYTLDPEEAAASGKELIEDLDDWLMGEALKSPHICGHQPFHANRMEGQDEFCTYPSKWLAENKEHPSHAAFSKALTVAQARSSLVMEDTDLPDEKSFKNAREFDPVCGIKTNMITARKIVTDRVREERNKRLVVEDINYIRAQENGDVAEQAAVVSLKIALRDLPATIQPELDALPDVTELESYSLVWPEKPE